MAKRKKVDAKKLVQMVKDEAEQTVIMDKFGFKTSTQLRLAYANALMKTGEAPMIKGAGRRGKNKPVDMKVSVNKRGSLNISKKIIERMNVEIGEVFEAKKTASGIQLKKVVDKSESDTTSKKKSK